MTGVKAGLKETRFKAEEYDAEVPRCETRLAEEENVWAKAGFGRNTVARNETAII